MAILLGLLWRVMGVCQVSDKLFDRFATILLVSALVVGIIAVSTRCTMDNSEWELASTENVYAVERVPFAGMTHGKSSYPYHLYIVILSDGGEASLEALEWTKVEKGDVFVKQYFRRNLDHDLKKIEYKYVGKPVK